MNQKRKRCDYMSEIAKDLNAFLDSTSVSVAEDEVVWY
jgi:hypothetical protein